MTAVEVRFQYGMTPDESVMQALDSLREVYGIRRLLFDENARTLIVEYDATRLNEATVENLLRHGGVDLQEKQPLN